MVLSAILTSFTFVLLDNEFDIRLDISVSGYKKGNFYIDGHCCLVVDRRAGQLRLQLLLCQLDLNTYRTLEERKSLLSKL